MWSASALCTGALYCSPCVTQQLLKMLSHAQLQLSHSWQGKGGDEHRQQEPSLALMASTPSCEAAGPHPWWVLFNAACLSPSPTYQAGTLSTPQHKHGQHKNEGEEGRGTFLLGFQYRFHRWFIWRHMWAHAVWTKEKLVAVSRARAHSIKWEQMPLSRAVPETLAYQQAWEWLGSTHFNSVRRY